MMLLQRLRELRRRDDVVERIPPPYHKSRDIDWIVELDTDGSFRGWRSAELEEPVPYLRRTVHPPPYLVVDQYPFYFGDTLEPEDVDPDQASRRHDKYVELIEQLREWLSGDDRELVDAFHHFLTSEESEEAFERIPEAIERRDLIACRVGDAMLHRRSGVRAFWAERRDASAAEDSQREAECIVCGEYDSIPTTQPVELVLGPERVQLISANENAFESFGLQRSAVAPVCQSCARQYGEAARFLLEEDRHHFRTGDVTCTYWSRHGRAEEIVSLLHSPEPERVDALVDASLSEHVSEPVADDHLYACVLSSNTSRLVVRDYVETTIEKLWDHLGRWFEAQRMVDASTGKIGEPVELFTLAASTTRDVHTRPPSRIVRALFSAAIEGSRLPRELLQQCLQRARSDVDYPITRSRAALMRMVLNDHATSNEEPTVSATLDPDDDRPAYLCGRLLAMFEEIQREAVGDVQTTITERYFESASTAPASAFGRLLNKAQGHLQTLRNTNRGAYVNLDQTVEDIMRKLDGFPQALNYEEQALFSLGYYHQRAQLRRDTIEAMEKKETA